VPISNQKTYNNLNKNHLFPDLKKHLRGQRPMINSCDWTVVEGAVKNILFYWFWKTPRSIQTVCTDKTSECVKKQMIAHLSTLRLNTLRLKTFLECPS